MFSSPKAGRIAVLPVGSRLMAPKDAHILIPRTVNMLDYMVKGS